MRTTFSWRKPESPTVSSEAIITENTLLDLIASQQKHWEKLHTTFFTPEELENWIRQIPGCYTCQRDFRILIQTYPPQFDDRISYFKWTWEVHNLVNRKLNKPEFTWTEACNKWGWKL
jgi:hypothetical protein